MRFDIAVAGFRGVGLDAKGHQLALLRQRLRQRHGLGKSHLVGNQVVCGQHQQNSVLAMRLRHLQGSGGNGGGRVAANGLQNVRGGKLPGVDFAKLIFGFEEQVAVGDGQDFLHTGQLRTA